MFLRLCLTSETPPGGGRSSLAVPSWKKIGAIVCVEGVVVVGVLSEVRGQEASSGVAGLARLKANRDPCLLRSKCCGAVRLLANCSFIRSDTVPTVLGASLTPVGCGRHAEVRLTTSAKQKKYTSRRSATGQINFSWRSGKQRREMGPSRQSAPLDLKCGTPRCRRYWKYLETRSEELDASSWVPFSFLKRWSYRWRFAKT